jgi:dynein heavy chain, axonemal
VLSTQKGHAILIGMGGSGRTILSKMAMFIQELELMQIEMTKNYKESNWKDDLK